MRRLVQYGCGQPRILHLLGDHAYWLDSDGRIGIDDAGKALIAAARECTSRYVGPHVLSVLKSPDYRSILRKISEEDPLAASFSKSGIAKGLGAREKTKLDNFLRRMKQLKVLRQGEDKGEWVFNMPMVRTAICLLAEAAGTAKLSDA